MRAENFNGYLTSTPEEGGKEDMVAECVEPHDFLLRRNPRRAGRRRRGHAGECGTARRQAACVGPVPHRAGTCQGGGRGRRGPGPTVEKLEARYPVSHDEYLPAFNRAKVTLVGTDGKGIDGWSRAGVVY